jgi:AcrR family transcriptional regulator
MSPIRIAPIRFAPVADTAGDRRTRRARGELTREEIVASALDLLDEEGAFTMRKVAQRLDVGTMTLYGHFRHKDELLDAVVEAGVPRIVAPAEGPWHERLKTLMLAMHEEVSAHPGLARLRFERPLVSAGALEITEAAMAMLDEGGFDTGEAATAYRVLLLFVLGAAAFGPTRDPEHQRAATREALGQLDRDRFPALLAAAKDAQRAMGDPAVVERGLDAILHGLAAMRGAETDP